MKKKVKVVGAIIENDSYEILCALRSPKMVQGNLWEFPGGKIEDVKTDSNDKPLNEVKIESIKVDTKGKEYKEPEKIK